MNPNQCMERRRLGGYELDPLTGDIDLKIRRVQHGVQQAQTYTTIPTKLLSGDGSVIQCVVPEIKSNEVVKQSICLVVLVKGTGVPGKFVVNNRGTKILY